MLGAGDAVDRFLRVISNAPIVAISNAETVVPVLSEHVRERGSEWSFYGATSSNVALVPDLHCPDILDIVTCI